MVQSVTIDTGDCSFHVLAQQDSSKNGSNINQSFDLPLAQSMLTTLTFSQSFLCIGSEQGLYALYIAAHSSAEVLLTEPNKKLQDLAVKNIELNNWQERFTWLGDIDLSDEEFRKNNQKLEQVGLVYFDADRLPLATLKRFIDVCPAQPAIFIACSDESKLTEATKLMGAVSFEYKKTFGLSMTHQFQPKIQMVTNNNSKQDNAATLDLKAKLDEANKKYRHATEQVAALKQQLQQAKTETQSSQAQLSDALAQAKQTEQALQAEIAQQSDALFQVKQTEQALQAEIAQQSDALVQAKQTEQQLKAELYEQKQLTEQHNDSSNSYKQQLEQANAKYRSATEQIDLLKDKLQQSNNQLTAAQLKQVAQLEQVEQLTRQLEHAGAQQLQAAQQLAQLQQQLTEQQEFAEQQKQQLVARDHELQNLKAQLEQNQQQLLQQQRQSEQDAAEAAEQINLLKDWQQIKQRSVQLDPLYQQLEQQLHSSQQQQQQLSQQVQQLQQQLELQQQQNNQAEQRHKAAVQQLDNTAAQLQLSQQQQQQLKQAYIADNSELDTLKALAKPVLPVFQPDSLVPAPLYPIARQQANYQQVKARLAGLKVACIMDEFTFGSYAPEANLLQLTPQHWQRELAAFKPEILFIESAWRGKHEIWGNKVGHKCQELVEIVAWCNQHKVPTVFWNKEDPVHFETFISTAKLFDHVFTTDLDCIHRYKDALQHDRVYLLPFAAQPAVNNPVEKYPRKNAFCFAGAYYVRYPDRTRDLESFIQALPVYRPLEIYDRNFGKDDANYQFPPEYQPYIVGNLPYEEIDKAYKGYKYAINLNSIKHSQTMFARRVFELLASNTLTLSNYARGVKHLFGDLVACSDSGEQLLNWLYQTEQTEQSSDALRLQALRAVMQYHTYQDRLAYVANKAGLLSQSEVLPCVTLLAYAASQQRYDRIVSQFNQQHYQHKRLILTIGADVSQKAKQDDIVSLDINDVKNLHASELVGPNGWLGFMVAEDEYAPDYLTDMALATRYASGKALGKASHWRYTEQGELGLNYPGRRYHTGAELEARHALVQASLLDNADLYQHLRNLHKLRFNADDNLAIDAMNYCKAGALCTKPADLAAIVSQYNRQPAADYIALQQFAEAITAPGKAGSLVISAAALQQQINTPVAQNGKLKASLANDQLLLRSSLAEKKHSYCYLAQNIALAQWGTDAATSAVQFGLYGRAEGLDAKMVLQWLAQNDDVIEQHFADINQSVQSVIPAGAVAIKLGLRLAGPGSVLIDNLSLQPLNQLTSTTLPALEAEALQVLFKAPEKSAVSLSLANQVLDVVSQLPDGKHEYYYAAKPLALSELSLADNNELNFHLETTPGLNLQLLVGFLDAKKQKISHDIRYANKNHSLDIPEGTAFVQLALRFYAGGACAIKRLVWGHIVQQPQPVLTQSDVLLLTNHYPSYQDLYRNGFVHSRVKAYREHNVKVDVFRMRLDEPVSWHEYQGIEVITASQHALRQMLASGAYRHVLVHFLDASMWEVLKDFIDTIKVTVWVHGAEIQPWWRRDYNYKDDNERELAKAESEIRLGFWQKLLSVMPNNLKLVFVSKYFAEEVMEDIGFRLPEHSYSIIHNPVDTDLFNYLPKDASQRLKVLSIRPYASRKYANDLSVKAVLEVSKSPEFSKMEFRFMGDGALFDETLEPLRNFENVIIERRFLPQQEIAALHKQYGVFLCPTRMDAQGVSKDEAMSSGLVVVSNAVTAIPEFIDDTCGILAAGEDYVGMAKGIVKMLQSPPLFEELSMAAATRARSQVAKPKILAEELELFSLRNTHA